MEKVPFRFPKNARIKLRGDIHPMFYQGFGVTGNEGWVRARDRDPHGYPRIFVEWDKDHWAYNGAEDAWTWEGHFDLVEDSMSEKKISEEEKIARVVASVMKAMQDEDPEPEDSASSQVIDITGEGEAPVEGVDTEAQYQEILKAAIDATQDAEAFVIVAIRREEDPRAPKGLILPAAFRSAKTPESGYLVDLQLSRFAISAYEDLVIDRVKELFEEEDQRG